MTLKRPFALINEPFLDTYTEAVLRQDDLNKHKDMRSDMFGSEMGRFWV